MCMWLDQNFLYSTAIMIYCMFLNLPNWGSAYMASQLEIRNFFYAMLEHSQSQILLLISYRLKILQVLQVVLHHTMRWHYESWWGQYASLSFWESCNVIMKYGTWQLCKWLNSPPPKSAVVLSCISLLFCLIVITAYRKEDNCHAGSTLHLSVSLVLSLDSMVSMFLMLGWYFYKMTQIDITGPWFWDIASIRLGFEVLWLWSA